MAARFLRVPLFCALFLLLSPALRAQYCVTNLGGASGTASIDSVSIVGTTLAKASIGSAPGLYTLYPTSGNTTASLMQGQTYTLYTKYGFNSAIASLWIDYNQNFTFQPGEWTQITTSATTAAVSFTVPLSATTGTTRMRIRSRTAGNTNAAGDACSSFGSGETEDYTITITPAPACTGGPVVTGVMPAGPIAICTGNSVTLTVSAGVFSGLTYLWQQSINGGVTWTNTTATTATATFTPTVTPVLYRAIVTCTASTLTATSGSVSVAVSGPTYATVPYVEDFETWTNYCATKDVPNNNWVNTPSAGSTSWRRDDEGATAGWGFAFGDYTPSSYSGLHSARWHSVEASQGDTGNLNLYLNLSSPVGPKQLYFYHINEDFSGEDSLTVQLSTDGGATYTTLAAFDAATDWQQRSVAVNTNSATSVIRFQAKLVGFFENTDIGLDSVFVAPPCTGTPEAGVLVPGPSVIGCPGGTLSFSLQGNTMAGNLTYVWQTATSCTAPVWTTVAGATSATYTTPILTSTGAYRVIVTCAGSGLSDTTAPSCITVTPPAYATIPFVEDFETWTNYCATSDVPSNNWLNTPSTGPASWRRDDQGASAGWAFTFGDYLPASHSGQHSARWHSVETIQGDTGALNLYLNLSSPVGPKQLYFYHINQDFFGEDSLTVQLSTDGGVTFITLASYDTATDWRQRSVAINSNSATAVVRFLGKLNGFFENTDIGLDSVFVAPPCTGVPEAGALVPGPTVAGCPGGTITFSTQGTTLAGNLTYVWQTATSCTAPVWTTIAGATSATYTTPVLTATRAYRVIVTCAGSGLSDTTAASCVNVTPPTYATLPYVQGFESWSTRCEPTDVPDFNWASAPPTGDDSWRREDQGASAAWQYPPGGAYAPASFLGLHSARFHSYYAPAGSTGNLDLFVNASPAGNKELQFHFINDNNFFSSDSLKVYLSINNGASFSLLNAFDFSAGGVWEKKMLPFTSTSATTIIRFQGVSDYGAGDIGLDNVKVLLPCAGKPVAGTVAPLTPCSGVDFQLLLNGGTQASGLSFLWQQSTNGTTWTAVPGGTQEVVTYSITQPTYFRAIVTCANGGLMDTSAAVFYDLASFYYCYCESGMEPTAFDEEDIGNVTLRELPGNAVLFSNGTATPLLGNVNATQGYSNFTGLVPDTLYRDGDYNLRFAQISQSTFFDPYVAAVFIDYNRDGDFDPNTEQVFFGTAAGPTQSATGNFTVPLTSDTGITGMRVVMSPSWNPPQPCGLSFSGGETEDYLVYIYLPRCTGAPVAGTAVASDTGICFTDTVTLSVTGYSTDFAGYTTEWEAAPDPAGPWVLIANSQGQDEIELTGLTDTMYYRFRITCTFSNTSTVGNVVRVTVKEPVQCYCASYADGGSTDASDAGALAIGPFIINTGGPHLNNPTAVYGYTDRTQSTLGLLDIDSTYDLTVYHTMRTATHQDAKITLFMDFNNNYVYDLPQELVFTGYTTPSQSFVNGQVRIPATAMTGVETGMRLIVNEDIFPGAPSDAGCGPYLSGETEDYAIKFLPKGGLGLPAVAGALADVHVFPNPTGGRALLRVGGDKPLGNVDVIVTNITGQTISRQAYLGVGAQFTANLDLTEQPRGVYFVEVRAGGGRAVRKLVLQ